MPMTWQSLQTGHVKILLREVECQMMRKFSQQLPQLVHRKPVGFEKEQKEKSMEGERLEARSTV